MAAIVDYMTHEHRHCDELFSAAEEAASQGDWSQARAEWDRFTQALNAHLAREEEILFPRFEEQTGQTQGPTAVMRMEHQQMRGLVHSADAALTAQDDGEFLGQTETLMILIQQHNMKEEQILYPMSDQVLGGDAGLVERMQALEPA